MSTYAQLLLEYRIAQKRASIQTCYVNTNTNSKNGIVIVQSSKHNLFFHSHSSQKNDPQFQRAYTDATWMLHQSVNKILTTLATLPVKLRKQDKRKNDTSDTGGTIVPTQVFNPEILTSIHDTRESTES